MVLTDEQLEIVEWWDQQDYVPTFRMILAEGHDPYEIIQRIGLFYEGIGHDPHDLSEWLSFEEVAGLKIPTLEHCEYVADSYERMAPFIDGESTDIIAAIEEDYFLVRDIELLRMLINDSLRVPINEVFQSKAFYDSKGNELEKVYRHF